MSLSAAPAAKPKKEPLDPAVLKVAVVLVIGALAPLLDSTMVNVALQMIGDEMHSAVSAVQWIVTGYALAMGLAVPVSGWAISRFGGKAVYQLSLLLFLIGSVLCAFAWNIESLVGFRVIQGLGAGLLTPTMSTLLVRSSGGRNLGRLMSVIGIPVLLGPILGPMIGGIVVDQLDWHWIFYINIPICLIATVMAQRSLPADPPHNRRQPLDIPGLLLLTPAFILFIFGLSRISGKNGRGSFEVLGCLGAAIILMAAFILYALRTKREPAIDLRLFRSSSFSASAALLFLSGIASAGAMLLIPLYYQQVRGESVLYTGLLMIPQGVGMLLTRSWVGSMTDRIGEKLPVLLGLAATIAGTVPFAFADTHTSSWLLGAALLIRGAGLNGLTIPVMTSVYSGLDREQIPHASSATRILQQIGGAFGAAVLATVVAHRLSGQATATAADIAGAYDSAFWWAIGLAVLAVIPALLLPKRKKAQAEETAAAS